MEVSCLESGVGGEGWGEDSSLEALRGVSCTGIRLRRHGLIPNFRNFTFRVLIVLLCHMSTTFHIKLWNCDCLHDRDDVLVGQLACHAPISGAQSHRRHAQQFGRKGQNDLTSSWTASGVEL